MEEIINSVMQSPENTNPNVLRSQLKAIQGEGSGSSGGGVLMVTDTDGTLDKTMGEIQDAYLAGKRVTINWANTLRDVIGMYPVTFAHRLYTSAIITYDNSSIELSTRIYSVFGETEEAVRNAYPEKEDK